MLNDLLHDDAECGAVHGLVLAELRGPDGQLKQRSMEHNLTTDNGDAYYAQCPYGTKNVTNGMKLGTATTAASKSGAGSYIAAADYISGSALACTLGVAHTQRFTFNTGSGTAYAVGDEITATGGKDGIIIAVTDDGATGTITAIVIGSDFANADAITGSGGKTANINVVPTEINNVILFSLLYGAGAGTSTNVNRVAIVDNITNAGEADATHTENISVFPNTIAKGAKDTLQIYWYVAFLGV